MGILMGILGVLLFVVITVIFIVTVKVLVSSEFIDFLSNLYIWQRILLSFVGVIVYVAVQLFLFGWAMRCFGVKLW